MSGDANLPVILVSAVDAATASAIITEIMNDGTEQPQCNGAGHSDAEDDDAAAAPVWQLRNKYYSARVRLRALPDGAAPRAHDDVQAHLIYLTEEECGDSGACRRRAEAAGAARGAVRLIAARAAREPRAPARWARDQRYELVALLAAPEPDDEQPPEARGLARVREALHAHVWPGLRRAGAAARAPAAECEYDSSADSSDDSWGSWRGADGAEAEAEAEAGAVRRAEQFAEALALLPARAAAHDTAHDTAPAHDTAHDTAPAHDTAHDTAPAHDTAHDTAPAHDDATRRLHAEQLVAVFCRALGHELRGAGAGDGGQ